MAINNDASGDAALKSFCIDCGKEIKYEDGVYFTPDCFVCVVCCQNRERDGRGK